MSVVEWTEWAEDGPKPSSNPAVFLQPFEDALCQAFKSKKPGDVHQKAREVLKNFVQEAYRGEKPELAGDDKFINQIAGALFAASSRIGEFDVASEDEARKVCQKVAQGLGQAIGQKYGPLPGQQSSLSSPRKFGCFPAGSAILMADGRYLAIEQVAVGELILACDEKTKEFMSAPVMSKMEADEPGFYIINHGDFGLNPTGSQPLFAQKVSGQEGWAVIEHKYFPHRLSLELGDRLFSNQGQWLDITDITYVPGKIHVYNFKQIGYPHTFFVGGVMAHNDMKSKLTPAPEREDRGVLVHNGGKDVAFLAHNVKKIGLLAHNVYKK